MIDRPITLTIAGFDPSAGAGILADVKTFEMNQCYGISIMTANTIQHDHDFMDCYWVDPKIIQSQLTLLLKRFDVKAVKIGIVQNWQILLDLLKTIRMILGEVMIVWDPVLKSSTAFDFHESEEEQDQLLDQVLDHVNLITPNLAEIENLYQNTDQIGAISRLLNFTNVLLKGGHSDQNVGVDQLHEQGGRVQQLLPDRTNCSEKHGSGCVLSSAIAAQLALGSDLSEACKMAKQYIESVLCSNNSLLGYHFI